MTHRRTLSDQIAAIAEAAWPLYRDTQWKWRDQPVTLAMLTAALTDMAIALIEGRGYSTGGLQLGLDEEDNLYVSVDVGFISGDDVQAWRQRAHAADRKDGAP